MTDARLPVCLAALVLLFPAHGFTQGADDKGRAVAKLRVEVETLAAEVEAERRHTLEEERRFGQEVQELQLAIEREQASIRSLETAREATEARIRAAAKNGRSVGQGALLSAIQGLEDLVRSGLPFRTTQRLRALADLRRGLERETLATDRAATRMWRFVQEELRLAETSGLGRRAIHLDDETIMAEVARMGMVALLFRLPDGRTGYTRPPHEPGADYRFVLANGPEETQAIQATFDALGRGRSPGRLMIPAACLAEDR